MPVAVALPVAFAPDLAWADGPAPVSDLALSTRDARVIANWTSSPDTSQAKVCWALQQPPPQPDSLGATCSDVLSTTTYSFDGMAGQTYGVSVFSYDSATSTTGPAVSDTITAEDLPPVPVHHLRTTALTYAERAVQVDWTDPDNADAQSYEVSVAQGLDTPEYTPGRDQQTSQTRVTVQLDDPTQVYTIAVRVKDESAQVGDPATLHVTARTPGLSAADDRAEDIDRDLVRVPISAAALSGQRDGHLRAAYLAEGKVWYTSRVRSEAWSHPISVSGDASRNGLRDVMIDSTAAGDVAIAWSARVGVMTALRHSGKWSMHRVNFHRDDRATGVTVDGRGNVHVLVRRTTAKGGGLLLFTRNGKNWVQGRFPNSGRYDRGLLTDDRSTHQVVVVDRHNGSNRSTIRLARVAASDHRIGTAKTVLDRPRSSTTVEPTSVTAADGRIVLALERRSASGDTSEDGVFTLTVTDGTTGSPVRVPHTTEVDTAPVVVAYDADHVTVSFRRSNADWSPDVVGVWVSQLTRNHGAWEAGPAERWSSSAYDVPAGAFPDDRGHLFVGYVTVMGDVTE
jgi:hypothetical protein